MTGLHGEVEERERKLREADEWLKKLMIEADERGRKLAIADEWLKNGQA